MTSTELVLPSWMNGYTRIKTNILSDSDVISQNDCLKFKGKIVYHNSVHDIAAASENLLNLAEQSEELTFGFDLEWPIDYKNGAGKTSLIQICLNRDICYLFHVSLITQLPRTFIILLKHPKVKLVGLNIKNDIQKLGRDFKLDVSQVLFNNVVELSSLANEKLCCSKRWSLARLVLDQLKLHLEKPREIRISNWSHNTLSKAQLIYAATDAYASLLCYQHLNCLLPSYSFNDSEQPSCENKLKSSISADPRLDVISQNNFLKFKGKIVYHNNVHDIGAASENLLNVVELNGELNLGFDLEWPFDYKNGPGKTSLIQICVNSDICYLFHVSEITQLPRALIILLKHPKVKLAGLNIKNDIQKLGRDFKLDLCQVILKNIVELSSLANEKLFCSKRWSLARLVLDQLKLHLEKPREIRISNWSHNTLSKAQLIYAATDAYASLLCYQHLNCLPPSGSLNT